MLLWCLRCLWSRNWTRVGLLRLLSSGEVADLGCCPAGGAGKQSQVPFGQCWCPDSAFLPLCTCSAGQRPDPGDQPQLVCSTWVCLVGLVGPPDSLGVGSFEPGLHGPPADCGYCYSVFCSPGGAWGRDRYSFIFFFFFFLFRTAPEAYGSSQARDPMGAVAAGLHYSHTGPEPCPRPIPQLTTVPDP